MTMTEKQKRFCNEYLIDLNATQAAIRAGYSKKNANNIASENLAKPNIKSYIEERMREKEDSLIAKQDEVLKYLTSVMRGDSESSVLAMCGDGCQEVIEKAPDEKERLRAAELIGKRYGLFTDKVDVNNESEKQKQKSISNIEALIQQMIPVTEEDISE